MKSNIRAGLKTFFLWAWTLFPLAVLIACVIRYAVDVPFWDQWSLVPLIEKSYKGTLTLRNLLAQYNEHRLFFPRVWMLTLIRWTHWNVIYDLAGILLLAVILFGVLWRQANDTFRLAGLHQPVWLVPVFSTFIFSLQQWPNWFRGHHTDIVMAVPLTVFGLFTLTKPKLAITDLLTAVLLGFIATLSFSTGILYWPISLIVLWINLKGSIQRARWLWFWALTGGSIVLAYLLSYHPPARHAPIRFGLEHPLAWIRYVLIYLGAPLLPNNSVHAEWAGVIGIGLLIWTGWTLRRDNRFPSKILLPYAALALYALASACLTAIGRVGLFGSVQALSGRYIIYSNLLWISVCTFLALAINNESPKRSIFRLVIGGIFLLVSLNSVRALENLGPMRERLLIGRAELLRLEDDSKLQILSPRPDIVRKRAGILRKYRLSVFRNPDAGSGV